MTKWPLQGPPTPLPSLPWFFFELAAKNKLLGNSAEFQAHGKEYNIRFNNYIINKCYILQNIANKSGLKYSKITHFFLFSIFYAFFKIVFSRFIFSRRTQNHQPAATTCRRALSFFVSCRKRPIVWGANAIPKSTTTRPSLPPHSLPSLFFILSQLFVSNPLPPSRLLLTHFISLVKKNYGRTKVLLHSISL